MSGVITSQSLYEEEGDDEHENRQDDEDTPDATEADHISAHGEIKPQHQDNKQETKIRAAVRLTVSRVRKGSCGLFRMLRHDKFILHRISSPCANRFPIVPLCHCPVPLSIGMPSALS